MDPSLTAAILRTTASGLVQDLETLGFLFECMCMRDLLIYGQVDNAEICYYRDREGLEADAIIQAEDGRWAGIEIKLEYNQADKAAAKLLNLKRKIVGAGGKPPAFLTVLEGLGDFFFVRPDGAYVIPIAALTV